VVFVVESFDVQRENDPPGSFSDPLHHP
jgi:hypothetical protein